VSFGFFNDDIPEEKIVVNKAIQIEIKEMSINLEHLVNEDLSKAPNPDWNETLLKVANWLMHQKKIGKLPKIKEKLSKSISKMCLFKKTVDINYVKQELIAQGYMTINPVSGEVNFVKKNNGKYQIPSSSYAPVWGKQISDEEIVLEKCQNWIESRENFPKTIEKVDKSLLQLAQMKKEIDVNKVHSYFEELGVFSFDIGNNVIYNF